MPTRTYSAPYPSYLLFEDVAQQELEGSRDEAKPTACGSSRLRIGHAVSYVTFVILVIPAVFIVLQQDDIEMTISNCAAPIASPPD